MSIPLNNKGGADMVGEERRFEARQDKCITEARQAQYSRLLPPISHKTAS